MAAECCAIEPNPRTKETTTTTTRQQQHKLRASMFRQLSTFGGGGAGISFSLLLTVQSPLLSAVDVRIPSLAAYQMTLYKIYTVNIRLGESRIRRKCNRQQQPTGEMERENALTQV